MIWRFGPHTQILEAVLKFVKNSFTDLSGLSCPSFFSQIANAILFKKVEPDILGNSS